ncbi:hypothetical protein ASD11_06660 [Aeromicrobium sp. Root495]|uniref:DUF6989 domain-containing protein n=1 Tax=Aeromicrobium sp. Root495 TaxID=1736550 RepID=UPI0006FF9D9A|nr:hypothetical protein ASD11_06660 [Aeromicrobium sp. Root495]
MTDRSTLTRVLLVHVGLAVVGIVALSIDAPARGWAVLATVIVYVVALAAACRSTGHTAWLSLVGFLCLVSAFQVVPDWILSDVLGILSFPDQGGPRFDDVIPVAMGLMWVPPLFIALAVAGLSPGRSAVAAVIVFAGSELLAPVVGLWEPTGSTTRLLGVALYVLPAEAALGWAAAMGHRASTGRGVGTKVAAAAAVSVFYTGALVVSYFVIDVADWRITT